MAAVLGRGGGAGHLSAFAGTCYGQPRGEGPLRPVGAGVCPGAGSAWARAAGRPACPIQVPPFPALFPRPRSLRPSWGGGGASPSVGDALSLRDPQPPTGGARGPGRLEVAVRPGHGPCVASRRDRFVQILCVCGDGLPPRAWVPILAVPGEPGRTQAVSVLSVGLLRRLLTWNLRLFGVMY